MSFEGEPEIKIIDCDNIEIKKELHSAEVERIFGIANINMLDYSNIANEEIENVNPLKGYYNPPFELDEKSGQIIYKK